MKDFEVTPYQNVQFLPEIIQDHSKSIQETKITFEQRWKSELSRDFNEWERTRKYVLDNLHLLKEEIIPMKVTGVTNCKSHNCIIINDLKLYSYEETKELIHYIKEKKGNKDGSK